MEIVPNIVTGVVVGVILAGLAWLSRQVRRYLDRQQDLQRRIDLLTEELGSRDAVLLDALRKQIDVAHRELREDLEIIGTRATSGDQILAEELDAVRQELGGRVAMLERVLDRELDDLLPEARPETPHQQQVLKEQIVKSHVPKQ